jgi:formate--tetrahydrofolate ligase
MVLSAGKGAASFAPRHIGEVAEAAGILRDELELHGDMKAKVRAGAWDRVGANPDGKLILVTAMTATRAGEGKTLTSIGLSEAFGRLGVRHILALREPSLGPVFGMKGGGTGGGRAQLVPSDDINLHFNGDFHAITSAHNLLAACVDNSVYFGNPLGIERIVWPRVVDLCDRQLRQIDAGLGGKANGWPHRTGFIITAASEVMACVALARDLGDLQERLERIIVGFRTDGTAVAAREIGCTGAMMALLRDAVRPNLVQTLEGTPALVHCGPFGNIAHGCNSIAATRMALKLADYVITEAGFAADLGAEKFLHIKCRQGGFRPSAAVVVVTCRALRAHGVPDGGDWTKPDKLALQCGLANARVHVHNMQKFGLPVVLAANHFADDDPEELELVREFARSEGVGFAVSEAFARGGEGAVDLAREVLRAADQQSELRFLYGEDQPLREKIAAVAHEVYRTDGVDYDKAAEASIAILEANGLAHLPVCMAKTQMSISDNPDLRGAPNGWRMRVRDLYASAGAGFIVVLTGKMLLMPGMPEHAAFERIRLNQDGQIEGLF